MHLQHSGELGVPVGHVHCVLEGSLLLVSKSADDVAKSQQPAVDVDSLLQPACFVCVCVYDDCVLRMYMRV